MNPYTKNAQTGAFLQTGNESFNLNLVQMFFELRRRFVQILLAALIGGVLAGSYSRFMITPKYRSTAMMYVLSKETTLTSLADLQIGSQLTNDYKTIVTSRPVLESVVKELELPYNYKALSNKITINNPLNTRIITITVEDPDPAKAKLIADAVAETSSDLISEIMEMIPPKMIESGEIATQKSSPANGKNAVLGAIVGVMIMCGWIILNAAMNDTISSADDVTNRLGISVLASVPARANMEDEEKKPGSRKKKRGSLWGKIIIR